MTKWPLELIVWSVGLIILANSYPSPDHFAICPLDNAGVSWCPGCGLGRSISYLLHGEIGLSFDQHWFGMPAFIILINRIMQLLKKFLLNLIKSKKSYYGQGFTY